MDDADIKELMRQAASVMGRARSEKKAEAVRQNGKLGGRPKGSGKPYSEQAKARMRLAQQARRKRERQEQAANAEYFH